jgi:uncharacterized RDD family membrane protein YckC
MQENATSQPKIPGVWHRLAAMLYESFLILAVLMAAGFIYIPLFGNANGPLEKAVFQLYLLIVLMIYFLVFWTRGGQTLAMKTWRIRLTNLSGANISLPQGILRFFLAIISLVFLGAGFLWMFFDPQKQFLHDRLAKTRLIRTI